MPVTVPAQNYSSYPGLSDVQLLLSSSGISLPATYDASYEMYGAISEWETATNCVPFLAGASATYKFDPPGPNWNNYTLGGGRRLLLPKPFATITAVKIGVTPDYAGQTLTENTDFWLLPANHAAEKRPITEIRFAVAVRGPQNSIEVTGTPGYYTTINAEVWNAIRCLAAARICKSLRESFAVDANEWSEGDVSEKLDANLLKTAGDGWLATAQRAMAKYRYI